MLHRYLWQLLKRQSVGTEMLHRQTSMEREEGYAALTTLDQSVIGARRKINERSGIRRENQYNDRSQKLNGAFKPCV